jgi:hypothetical protein
MNYLKLIYSVLQTLYNHRNLYDEGATKKINQTSITMMVIFSPTFFIPLLTAIFTERFFFLWAFSGWFVVITIVTFFLQIGFNFARKAMMIISVLNILGGIISLSNSGEILILTYSLIIMISSAYTFVLMWGTESVLRELTTRRKMYSSND